MSHSPDGNTFSNLAFDVLAQIFVLTTPQDVFSLRMCCKTLCAVTRHRHVWLQLLRRSCFIYRLFPPTFPFDKMTASELEHAVTSPYQFTTMLKRAADALDACNKLSPHVTRILHCNPPHLLPDISTIYLVPGGRFLITSSTAFVMSLWDLGYSSNISIDHSPVASMVFKHIVSEFEVQATADDMGIRICIVAPSPLSPPSTLVKVLEIFPSSPSASFSQIAEFSIPHPLLCYSFHRDMFAYNYRGYVGVHNFVSDMAVVWHIAPNDASECDIFVFEDTILLLQEDHLHKEFSLWRIPPLKPVLGICHSLVFPVEIFRLHSPNQYCYVSSQSAWFRSYPDDTHHIDLLGIANNGQNGIARYVLKHINRNRDLYLPPFIPVLSLQFLPHQGYHAMDWIRGFNSTRLWDDSALLLWVEDQTLVANLSQIFPNSPASSAHSGVVDSPTSEDDGEEHSPWRSGKSTSTILYDKIDQAWRGGIAHCPMSGRLCVLSSNGIHVVDYLVPPA